MRIQISTREGTILRRKVAGSGHARTSPMADILKGTRGGRGQHWYGADADRGVLDVLHVGATWQIQLNCPQCGDDAALCQITLTTC